jgi:4-hydroxy-4-methyl-2-oxoglutarate aldolase
MDGDSDPAPVSPALLEEVAGFGAATLHEAAGRIGALPGAIAPLDRRMKLWGRALPVSAPADDNLALHRAIAEGQPGDVLVVENGGSLSHGPFGDILALAAKVRGIRGLVIDGGVRDSESLIEIGFPVFARGCSIRGTIKRDPGRVGEPVTIGGIEIRRGDIVIGDADGVVILPAVDLAVIHQAAIARMAAEADLRQAICRGELTLDLLGLSRLVS